MTAESIKVIVADKDFTERSVLCDALKPMRMLLCQFHVISYMKKQVRWHKIRYNSMLTKPWNCGSWLLQLEHTKRNKHWGTSWRFLYQSTAISSTSIAEIWCWNVWKATSCTHHLFTSSRTGMILLMNGFPSNRTTLLAWVTIRAKGTRKSYNGVLFIACSNDLHSESNQGGPSLSTCWNRTLTWKIVWLRCCVFGDSAKKNMMPR